MVAKPGDISYSLSTRFGGRGLGLGGKTTAGNFLTGYHWAGGPVMTPI